MKKRSLKDDQHGIVTILIVVFLVIAIILIALFWFSGWRPDQLPGDDLGGYMVSVPLTASVNYQSYEQNNGLDQVEQIYVNWQVNTQNILGRTIAPGEFSRIIAGETTEHIGVTNNWMGEEDYTNVLDNEEGSAGNESKTWHTGDIDNEQDGYMIASKTNFNFQFFTNDGSMVYQKIMVQPLTMRIQAKETGVENYQKQFTVHCYIPKFVLPNGTRELQCKVDYEVTGHAIKQYWGNGAFKETIGAMRNNWNSLVNGGLWNGAYTKLLLLGIAVVWTAISWGLLAATCLVLYIQATSGGTDTFQKQSSNQIPVKGSGTITFTVTIPDQVGDIEGMAVIREGD